MHAQEVLHAARKRSNACIAREEALYLDATWRDIAPFMSASTVRRCPAQDALKPWQHRSWIFITSHGFRLKTAWVLDLYARTWQDKRLGDDEYVISANEETCIQARCRCPPLAPGKARAMRVNHTYGRGGTGTESRRASARAARAYTAPPRFPHPRPVAASRHASDLSARMRCKDR
ncbi:hypothetical protein [Streptomyces canus]|uniref:hypothetical protein n=1 Tax=Streptomyces canus TaxID=58343 RepID=UPI00371153AD